MKVEVGKFYKTRGGQKVGPMEKKPYGWIAGNGRIEPLYCIDWYDDEKYNYYHAPSEHDLIEEWKEPEVKEPKFKVGDYIRQDEKYWKPEGYKVVEVTDDLVFLDPETDYPSFGYSKSDKWIVVEQKPEITVGSRWTNIGKESKTVTVVHINDKYVTFEHDERGTIQTNTYDMFYMAYKPYVEPPKSLVGYVGVYSFDSGEVFFGPICNFKSDVVSSEMIPTGKVTLLSVKKIEWTEVSD